MNGLQIQILLTVGAGLATVGLLLLSGRTIRYAITPTHLTVFWLGLPVRRLRLEDIKRVGVRPVVWAERWPNTWERGRLLVIRRNTGLFRNVVITPKFPFEFRNRIEQARRALLGLPLDPVVGASAGELTSELTSDRPTPKGPPVATTKDAA